MPKLGVNIDHVATVRQARKTIEPDPVWAAALSEMGGADGITIHLREDRRHIQDRDLELLKQTVKVSLNLEMAAEPEMIEIACRVKPDQVTLVPEKREEVTTEGGLDLLTDTNKYEAAVKKLKAAGIIVSLFLDAEEAQINTGNKIGADAVELHTGKYALTSKEAQQVELVKLTQAGKLIREQSMTLLAGHGLTYSNVLPIARIPEMSELNIGHSIVSRALMVGFEKAVYDMKQLLAV